ncbi:bifunctional 2-polyprenyl-6-hydroxyphenol methylase/3-demethylubiquinol 3-O-methyltransferase UbiG [uncultured Algimonas sp.]|uniref:bifunctional 2-polyprenyl-6-hydroxyphenol methylase/3-demethylubiquinol 3-O-methyltransferase UbiG n=1 Tax=uncultured Algimonas sp. TaxID=1547920 RepID=UPI00260ED80F|nr:bifunctional 2-polyprenyl-6-hydroxyphenol methylase/3-demethylubiquinol 3-O-methyltransferase UbiG [uncultured Algimonas sp.]
MAHDTASAPDHLTSVSVDPREMESFSRMAHDWWNPDGMFRPLHVMNGARIDLIKQSVCDHFGRDPDADRPLEGLRLLDIGCGGGLLCEPMVRLGAQVTGVDALERNVKTAKTHAEQVGVPVDYRHGTIEQMVEAGEAAFDVVLNMEVIEHVANPQDFIADCTAMVGRQKEGGPGGIMICSTINRTLKAFAFAIVGAEYILRWLPRGTHQYDKLVKPGELRHYLEQAGLQVDRIIGMSLNPLTESWRIGDDTSINYVTVATRGVHDEPMSG